MERNRPSEKSAYYFSALYGGGIYAPCAAEKNGTGEPAALFQNAITGKTCVFRRVSMQSEQALHLYRRRIEHPPSPGGIVWPLDLVRLTGKQTGIFAGEVEHIYRDAYPDAPHNPPPRYAAVFPALPVLLHGDGESRVEKMERDWNNPEIQRTALRLAEIIDQLNRDGYIYNEMHLSRLLFDDRGRLYLDYSPFVCSGQELWGKEGLSLRKPGAEYPVEFADPSVIRGAVPAPDFQSQNVSLASILFFLLFNRLPYDGRMLSGRSDQGGSKWDHMLKFRAYYRMPIFVFDPVDTDNCLGYFAEEERTQALWDACPPELRDLFLRALRRGGPEYRNLCGAPFAWEWVRCFRRMGWTTD